MSPRIKNQIAEAKKVFAKLVKMYPDIPKFPLQFTKRMPRECQGYMQSSHVRGYKKQTIRLLKMVVLESDGLCFEMGYIVCHEFAHAIRIHRKADTRESKAHSNLTYKLAKKFKYCS